MKTSCKHDWLEDKNEDLTTKADFCWKCSACRMVDTTGASIKLSWIDGTLADILGISEHRFDKSRTNAAKGIIVLCSPERYKVKTGKSFVNWKTEYFAKKACLKIAAKVFFANVQEVTPIRQVDIEVPFEAGIVSIKCTAEQFCELFGYDDTKHSNLADFQKRKMHKTEVLTAFEAIKKKKKLTVKGKIAKLFGRK